MAKKSFFSVLSDRFLDRLFDNYESRKRTVIVGGSNAHVTTPPLETAQPAKLNHELVRQLYRNTHNSYAMAAHLVKPIVDSNVNFIGVPAVRSDNARTLKAIGSFIEAVPFDSVHKIAEREGVAFLWPQMGVDRKLRFDVLRPETVKDICIDPTTKEVVGYIIQDAMSYKKTDGNVYNIQKDITITSEHMIIKTTADEKQLNGVETVKNIFGFIPIVAFHNDREPWELRGHSEIENIEPQLKWYNDLTVEAGRAQKRDGHPKLKCTVNSVEDFINNNFGADAFARIQRGEQLDIDRKDIFFLENEGLEHKAENVGYVETNKTTGEYTDMSEKSFTNIIEGAQTPEINFGANMGTSLSSVREQRPAYIKKIQKKQKQYEQSWRKVMNIALGILGVSFFRQYEESYTFSWPTPDFASEQEKAMTLNTLMTSMIKAKQSYILGDGEIYDTLKKLDIIDVKQKESEHDKDVEDTAEKMRERNPDERAEQDNKMNKRVADGSYENTKVTDDNAEEEMKDAEEEE